VVGGLQDWHTGPRSLRANNLNTHPSGSVYQSPYPLKDRVEVLDAYLIQRHP